MSDVSGVDDLKKKIGVITAEKESLLSANQVGAFLVFCVSF